MTSHAVSRTTTTTIFLSNLHCASCVRTIEEALFSLKPVPTKVDVSIVLQSVTVKHPVGLSLEVMQATLDDAGFDISLEPVEPVPPRRLSGVGGILSGKWGKHVQQCSSCQEEASTSHLNGARENAGPRSPPSDDNSPDGHSMEKELPELQEDTPEALACDLYDVPHRLTLSVGGMTCSSCAGTITEMVSQLPGVSEVVVSLLSNSATLVVEKKDLIPTVTETIEDCGFEGEVVKAEPITSSGSEATAAGPRTISLRVDGMFCQHCPGKIMDALQKLQPEVSVTKPLTDYTDPVLELSYEPSPPELTIRSIISTIVSADPESFKVSIYRPPTLEQRTRNMQLREQKTLLERLLFTVIVAIPAFIVGVVYMSLVPAGNKTRDYLMEPMWNGNASRIQWALFFCATPVMFYGAGLFHRRSIKEITALWRRGSTTPIIKRFTRFGSMNLLVSTGVSVAYFSSIALLALAASQRPAANGMGDNTTYFDSVVFLTMFLLCGRYLEAYSKARTADAITALGSLRPAEALLVTPRTASDVPTPTNSKDSNRETILGVAAELESASSHPLGTAVKQYSEMHGADQLNATGFDEVAGRGLKARFDTLGCTAIIGNEAWMTEHGITIDGKAAATLGQWKTEAKSVILLAASEGDTESFSIVAIFAVTDPLRPEATGVIRLLHEKGIGAWMISGDNEVTAKAVAKMVGIPEMNVIAGVLPHQKAEKIEWLQKNGAKRPPSTWQRWFGKQRLNERCIVAMVGDGINDAPALAASDIGIAIGSGSDVAISSASFILVSSDLQSLLTLCDLARKVFNRVKLNFVWAFMYNIIALPVAAGVIYPAGHARLAPVWASLAMALSSVTVISSSLLLKLYREPKVRV
ncbi:hypothetical protein HYDPIDRAFT_122600 [Hydnomerulius pinastri MD-312]|nr:hypothetical protein HYDPIDRAFT_122600 [Hydnomerulius pinastri MD-312]